MALWMLLLFVGFSHGVYYGSVLNYYPQRNAGPNGTHLVEIHSEITTDNCSVSEWRCLGVDCTEVSTVTERVDPNSNGFCQTKTTTVIQVSTDAPFLMSLDAGSQLWVNNSESVKSIRASSVVDLRFRPDDLHENHPPQGAIMSPVRIPSNCAREMPLLAFDPDYDQVLCRYASSVLHECEPCPLWSLGSSLTLSPTCVLRWFPPTSPTPGLYVIDLVMEDTSTLYQAIEGRETKITSERISLVPLQFVLNMTSSIPSCAEGEYIPKFVDPTPEHGTHFYVTPGDTVQIVIQAEATAAAVEGLLFSGPANVTEEAEGNGRFVLTWTSSPDFPGRTYPLCFVARAEVDSEIRCVILNNFNISSSDYLLHYPDGLYFTYYPSVVNGSVMVTFRAKFSKQICFSVPEYFISGINQTFQCYSGDCENSTLVGHFPVDGENNGFCQTETVVSVKSSSFSPFISFIGGWPVYGDLRIRSDTGLPNRPPVSAYPPAIRRINNCPRDYKVLFFDEDGDDVRLCRGFGECTSCSSVTSYGTKFCTFSYPSDIQDGVVEILRDFPRQNLTLSHSNGSLEVRTPDDAFGLSYFSFTLQGEESAPSCTEGVYLPKFTSVTPEFGEILNATVGENLFIEVAAEANTSKVSELLFSGPHEMEKLTVREGQFQLQWTPSEAEAGQSHVVCFLVDAVVGSRRYQTEPRCVVVKVVEHAEPSTPAPPVTTSSPPDAEGDYYTIVMDAKVTSLMPLTDSDVENYITQIKSILVALGLPPETTVEKLRVSSSGEN